MYHDCNEDFEKKKKEGEAFSKWHFPPRKCYIQGPTGPKGEQCDPGIS